MVLAATTYRQKATYWGSPTQGGFGGITFAAPKEIMVRWEERVESFITVDGVEHKSKAIVHTMQDCDLGGYLAKGAHAGTNPTVIDGAYQIQRSDEIPDLRGLNTSYRNFL